MGKKLNRIKSLFTVKQAEGPTAIIEKVQAALGPAFPKAGSPDRFRFYWPRDVYDDYLVVEENDTSKLFRIPYAIGLNDEVTFGEPVEVEEEYVEVSAAQVQGSEPGTRNPEAGTVVAQAAREEVIALAAAEFDSAIDKTFSKTRWLLAKFGPAAHKQILKREAFERSLQKWSSQGSKCYLNHPPETAYYKLPERDLNTQLGWWSEFQVSAQGFEATLNLVPSADRFRLDLKAAVEGGRKDFFQPSILGFAAGKNVQHEASTWFQVEDFKTAFSIDMVNAGGAASEFQYALQSAKGSEAANHKGATTMDPRILAALFKQNPTRFALVRQAAVAAKAEGVTDQSNAEDVAGKIIGNDALVTQSLTLMQTPEGAGGGDEDPIAARAREVAAAAVRQGAGADPANPQSAIRDPQSEPEIPFRRMPKPWRESIVAQAYADSNLSEAVQQKVRTRVAARINARPELDELEVVSDAIEQAREVAGIVEQSAGGFNNPARGGVQVTVDRKDKIAIALAKAFGLAKEDMVIESANDIIRQSLGNYVQPEEGIWRSIPAIRSIKKLYIEMTGDESLTGARRNERITRQADWLTTDLPELLANVMGKRLLRDYRQWDSSWRRIVTIKALTNFKEQTAVLLGYFGDLPAVAQAGQYTDFDVLTDTKETYTPAKKGKIVPLTLETISNDDLQGFSRVVGRLGRAAARTLAKFVWNTLVMANPVLNADGKTLFHADHGNLITDAITSADGLKNAVGKLLSQIEPQSGEPMVLGTSNLTLAIPPLLYLDANAKTDFNNEPGGNVNALEREIRRLGITPVNVPVLTDANDWLLAADPADIDMVELGFWQGQEEPEYFTQNSPTDDVAFEKDVIMRVKVRHIYGGAPVDHRGLVKSAVV